MPDLSAENIGRISRDVRKQEITFSNLVDELIDHICCDVEYEMQNGLTFQEAYRRVKQKMSPRRLKEIQEETLYAVDTKYRKMKNLTKISSVAGAALFGFSALFKIQHWPGAGLMMTFGAVILAFVFMPSALGVLWKETHSRKRIFLFVSAFFAGMFFILGTLFKVQHWSGANELLMLSAFAGVLLFIPALIVTRLSDQERKSKRPVYIIGALGLILYLTGMLCKMQHWSGATILMGTSIIILCFALPWYTWLTWKEENHISSHFLFLIIGSLAIVIPGTLFNLSLQYAYEDGYFPNLIRQQEMYKYMCAKNNSLVTSYKDSVNYLQMTQIHSRTASLIELIGNIQAKMVQESEGEPGKPALSQDQIKQAENGQEIQYRLLSNPFPPAPVIDFLLPGSNSRQELDAALNGFREFATSNIPGKGTDRYLSLLEPSTYLPWDGSDGKVISLMTGLHSLELLKNGILTVEQDLLAAMAKHK
jgi:hypothetical protein